MVVFSLVKLVCTNVTMEGAILTVTVLVLLSLSQYVMIWRLRHDRKTHLYAYPTTVFPLMTRRIRLLVLLVDPATT